MFTAILSFINKARAVATNDFAAVKIIKLEPGDDFGIIQQEIIMMSECHHPNIVAYYGSYLRYANYCFVLFCLIIELLIFYTIYFSTIYLKKRPTLDCNGILWRWFYARHLPRYGFLYIFGR